MERVKHTENFRIDQPAGTLFPLFSPEGEKHWVPGWDYANVMGSTDLHENYVFVTKTHDHAAKDAVWLIKRFDSDAYRIELYKVEPEEKVGIVTVQCEPLSGSSTNVSVAYEYIALSEKGNAFVAGFTDAVYRQFIGEWKRLLEDYFAK